MPFIPCPPLARFQFTPLREGRRTAASTRKRLRNFNSRPSARGDGAGRIAGPMSKDFNSRPSARGDARFPRFPFGLRHFNSRPSARGDSWQPTRRAWMDIFQFTPLREGRRRWRDGNVSARRISIHAPPRGATGCSFQNNLWAIISIHAPPRGATKAKFAGMRIPAISIHAPPRGATRNYAIHGRRVNFNSRPSARGDAGLSLTEVSTSISIHAPPRGATLLGAEQLWRQLHFNSRPSARGDFNFYREAFDSLIISIHAPPRGATACTASTANVYHISIHAPPRGATWLAEEGED